MTNKTHMSPVAKSIRKTFEMKKRHCDRIEFTCRKLTPMCKRVPFDIWMNDYLFPELLQIESYRAVRVKYHWHVTVGPLYNWACYFLPEETILRIMAEAGIVD